MMAIIIGNRDGGGMGGVGMDRKQGHKRVLNVRLDRNNTKNETFILIKIEVVCVGCGSRFRYGAFNYIQFIKFLRISIHIFLTRPPFVTLGRISW